MTQKRLRGVNLLRIEYLAGFFDGEGCISYSQPFNRETLRIHKKYTVSTSQNLIEPLLLFQEAFGGHIYTRYPRTSSFSKQTHYVWVLSAQLPILNFLEMMAPLLIVKKTKAEEAISRLKIMTTVKFLLPDLQAKYVRRDLSEIVSSDDPKGQTLNRSSFADDFRL